MSVIRRVSEIPGPKSRALLGRKEAVVPRAIGVAAPVAVVAAQGAVVTDADGNRFVDLAGGIGSLNAGHSHPAIVQAVQRQAAAFSHTDFAVAFYEPYVALAERLCALAPVRTDAGEEKRAVFFNSGAEAVENAIKIARAFTGRPAVIAFEGAFHGRTLLALSLTSRVHPVKAGFGPFAPEVYRLPYPDPYRDADPEAGARRCLAALEGAFSRHVAADEVAALIVEPIQGEGGFIIPPASFLRGLREICDAHGIVLVADEIQSGYGRTGRMFASSRFGLEPDLITIGKSAGGGLPLSGVIGRARVMDAPVPGGLGGTMAGNPVACAAGLAVLDVIEREKLCERAEAVGERIMERLRGWQRRYPTVGDVRGMGAMVAAEFVTDRASKAPAGELVQRLLQAALRRGVIAAAAGSHGHVLRFLPPLNIPFDVLDESLAALEGALDEVHGMSA